MALNRLLVIPDVHRPFHDKKAWKLALNVGRRLFKGVPKKDRIIITLGDFLDFHQVSFHTKNPACRASHADEIADGKKGLQELSELEAGRKVFIRGNHEARWDKYIAEKSPELLGLPGLTVPEMLDLKTNGWEDVPYKQYIKIGHVYYTHDAGQAGPLAAQKARETFESNVVIGHNHTMASFYRGNAVGKSRVGMSFGWLGDIRFIDYMHKVQSARWQLGVGVGLMESNGATHLAGVPFIDYRAVVDGDIVKAA